MRSLVAMTTLLAMLVVQAPIAAARADTTPPAAQAPAQNSVIAAAFKPHPNGGEALSKQVAGLIISNPKLAPELVIYMRNTPGLNRAQKLAAEQGLAVAADELK